MFGCQAYPVNGGACEHPHVMPIGAVAYFISFVLLGTMIILNLLNTPCVIAGMPRRGSSRFTNLFLTIRNMPWLLPRTFQCRKATCRLLRVLPVRPLPCSRLIIFPVFKSILQHNLAWLKMRLLPQKTALITGGRFKYKINGLFLGKILTNFLDEIFDNNLL